MARSKFNVSFDDVMDETPVDNNILENKIITPEPKNEEIWQYKNIIILQYYNNMNKL